MRIPSASTDRYLYFVAVDSTDLKTRETGLSSFTVFRSRNGGTAAAMTTPTVSETSSGSLPGVYELLLDEDTTLDAGHDVEEMVFHITQASMAPVTRVVELYRPETTEGNTATVASDGDLAKVNLLDGHTAQTADHTAGIADVPTVSEFNARTLVAASYFDPAADTVANVTTVATLTGHTVQTADHTAGIADIPTVSEFNARTILAAAYFDPAADTVANVTTVATLTGHTVQTADHTAGIAAIPTTMRGTDSAALASVCTESRLAELDAANLPTDLANVPTVAEFNARTLAAASYFDPAADAIANVTLVATTTTVTNAVTVGTINDGAVDATVVADIFSTTALTETYAADAAAGTPTQILYLIQQVLTEFLITGSSLVIKKLDGSATAATITLNDATNPTGANRTG